MVDLRNDSDGENSFLNIEEETFYNILQSSECLMRAFQRKTRGWGVTSTQYSVLRILQGAEPEGLTCAAIGRRMIGADPDVTRLLDRLKMMKLVSQRRDRHDRRVVWTHITEAGMELLRTMNPVVLRAPAELLGHMRPEELAELTRLLELARSRCAEAMQSREPAEAAQLGPPLSAEVEQLA